MKQPDTQRQTLSGHRLSRHADYQIAYKAARKFQSHLMSWFMAPRVSVAETARVGLTAGKVLGPAHERNRIKRRMRDVLRKHTAELPAGCDLIFHPRRAVLNVEYGKLEAEVVRILAEARAQAERLPRQ